MIYTDKVAQCYDLFYRDKPYREEAEYASELVKARFSGAKTLLDLGCGTGMRSLEFARLGYNVCGVDQSSSMLLAARQHLAEAPDIPAAQVEFRSGDVTSFRTQSGCDAIVSLFHVFCYLTTLEELGQAFECAFANLNPGGVFLFDYWHGPGVWKDPPGVRSKVVENGDLRAERRVVPEHLADKHLVKLTVTLRVTDNDSAVPDETHESYAIRYWFTEELEEALKRSGFTGVRHYSWMEQSDPGEQSWLACTIAAKPG
ncbi:MAG TPA: class I SAM-dependent methyltransferase [Chthoniobacterales bacterium]|jgi:SAM-dependent methyltransferase|nr:class I SAM-dependent methyltransferase [Chthoniobacterales bacterium]